MNDSYYSILALEMGIGVEVLFLTTLIHVFPVLANEKKKISVRRWKVPSLLSMKITKKWYCLQVRHNLI